MPNFAPGPISTFMFCWGIPRTHLFPSPLEGERTGVSPLTTVFAMVTAMHLGPRPRPCSYTHPPPPFTQVHFGNSGSYFLVVLVRVTARFSVHVLRVVPPGRDTQSQSPSYSFFSSSLGLFGSPTRSCIVTVCRFYRPSSFPLGVARGGNQNTSCCRCERFLCVPQTSGCPWTPPLLPCFLAFRRPRDSVSCWVLPHRVFGLQVSLFPFFCTDVPCRCASRSRRAAVVWCSPPSCVTPRTWA